MHYCSLIGSIVALVIGLTPCMSLAEVQSKPATAVTRQIQAESLQELDFTDKRDFEDAKRGFIAPLPDKGLIKTQEGREVWNLKPYSFLEGDEKSPVPDTVNPSLFRQSRLVMYNGLFKVTDRIYQVRNADISNMTIIEGNTGLIIADPLVSAETAKAALELYYAHRPKKPVKYIIYSHSHVDHYGGVLGVTTQQAVQKGQVQILAPKGFIEAAVAENVFAGTAMNRRAMYMYVIKLPPSPEGHIGAGLGLKNSTGAINLLPPTQIITQDIKEMQIDGLTFVFLLAPNTEAPAEMHWYIKELKALTAAENCVHTMHNLYTLRGAKTRDPLQWAKALDLTLERFGNKTDVLYGMHHWPVWGGERVRDLLTKMSDLYRYIHDQTLHLANKGLTMEEIAEELRLPKELTSEFALRGYYGSVNHNVKAVYNLYLGWFDGNPAHLHVLPQVAAAKKYVNYMGGEQAVLERARADFSKGEYRWVAQVLNHVVFANPANREARELEADALEQLGYQAESGPWRNFYLMGARELRTIETSNTTRASNQQSGSLPPALYFANQSIRLNGARAHGRNFSMHISLQDLHEEWRLELRHGVLRAHKLPEPKEAQLSIKAAYPQVVAMFEHTLLVPKAIEQGLIKGDAAALQSFLDLFETFNPIFALVEP